MLKTSEITDRAERLAPVVRAILGTAAQLATKDGDMLAVLETAFIIALKDAVETYPNAILEMQEEIERLRKIVKLPPIKEIVN